MRKVSDLQVPRSLFARSLAHHLITTGQTLGRTCRALITDMNQPLGRTVGNALEVKESLEILRGEGPEDVRHLTLLEAAHMANAAKLFDTPEQAYEYAEALLKNGKAMEIFQKMCHAQGGNPEAPLPKPACTKTIYAKNSGFVTSVHAEKIGKIALTLGAGRVKVSDTPDPAAGIEHLVQQGEAIAKGDRLCTLCASTETCLAQAAEQIYQAITIADAPASKSKRVYEIIEHP